jgi:hypothetical protein
MHYSSPTFATSANHFCRSTSCIISSSTKLAVEGRELAIKWCIAIRGGQRTHIKILMLRGSDVGRTSFQVRVLFIPGIYSKRIIMTVSQNKGIQSFVNYTIISRTTWLYQTVYSLPQSWPSYAMPVEIDLKLTSFSPAVSLVNSSAHRVKHWIT